MIPRPGRHRRSTPVGMKARRFPTGSARFRLDQVLWPETEEGRIVRWLTSTRPAPARPDVARPLASSDRGG